MFEASGLELLRRAVLKNTPIVALESRHMPFWGLAVLRNFIFRFFRIKWRLLLGSWRSLRIFPFELQQAYLLACLDCIQPRVVLTLIDNSGVFHALSRAYPDAVFVAIQNGARTPWCMTEAMQSPPHPASRISMPLLFCFGTYEQHLYAKYGQDVDEFKVVGSLMAGYYAKFGRTAHSSAKFDICLISQWHGHFYEPYHGRQQQFVHLVRQGIDRLCDFLAKFLERHDGIRLAVATRFQDSKEIDFYRQYFGTKATYVDYDPDRFSTLSTIEASKVTVVFNSTAGYEAFGLRNKVLFCDLSDGDWFTCPLEGIWALNKPTYPAFESRIEELLALDREQFVQASAEARRSLMDIDPAKPAHEIIAAYVHSQLARGDRPH